MTDENQVVVLIESKKYKTLERRRNSKESVETTGNTLEVAVESAFWHRWALIEHSKSTVAAKHHKYFFAQ